MLMPEDAGAGAVSLFKAHAAADELAAMADWARRDYDPQAFAVWLNANGLGEAFNGIWEPWKPPSK